jgi:Putative MetA-pathway of phenol degradation
VRTAFRLATLALVIAAPPAFAGPPYLTDDPDPTDIGHWEIYGFTAGEGFRSILDEETGADLNYGPVEGVQLTATVPASVSHDPVEGWRAGTGDLELGVKYRFFHDEKHGLSAAIFPRAILPTSTRAVHDRRRFLLPLWLGKDFAGGTSFFGGGGYTFNPGDGNRSFVEAAIAVTQDVSKNVSVGGEVTRQGPDTVGGTAQTRAGVGAIIKVSEHYNLLFSGGPTWLTTRRATISTLRSA